MVTSILIGRGILNWHANERVSDRYGAVHLARRIPPKGQETTADAYIVIPKEVEDQHGRLYAIVVETRASYHVGDMVRGFYPSTPQLGDRIELGIGTLFRGKCFSRSYPEEEQDPIPTIGLHPDDGRKHDWLNPASLYKLHCQTVDLFFEPSM